MTSILHSDLSGHLALITGCTGGIGAATATSLASLNCNIAVHYNAAADKAQQLVSKLESVGVKAMAFQADLSSYDETRRLHSEVVDKIGHPTVLFNNHGITLKSGVKDISEISIEDFEKTWRTNCGTSYLLTQLCLPAMVEKEFGRIIFCSSVAGLTGGKSISIDVLLSFETGSKFPCKLIWFCRHHRSALCFLQVGSPWTRPLARKHVLEEGHHSQWCGAGLDHGYHNASWKSRGTHCQDSDWTSR